MLLLLLHCHLFCHLSCHLFCDMIAPHCGSRQGQYSTGRVHCSALLHYEATLESVRSATHTTHTQHTYTAHSIKHIALSARPPHTSTLRYSALLCSALISHIFFLLIHYTTLPCLAGMQSTVTCISLYFTHSPMLKNTYYFYSLQQVSLLNNEMPADIVNPLRRKYAMYLAFLVLVLISAAMEVRQLISEIYKS